MRLQAFFGPLATGAMALLLMTLSGCAAAGPAATDRPSIDNMAWLTGMWIEEKPGRMTVETWSAPRPSADNGARRWMVGLNILTRDGTAVFHEYLRLIDDESGLLYVAAPLGRDPGTRFHLVEHGAGRMVFENPEHDFPQRIIYERLRRAGFAEQLRARIEGMQNGSPSSAEWVFTRERD